MSSKKLSKKSLKNQEKSENSSKQEILEKGGFSSELMKPQNIFLISIIIITIGVGGYFISYKSSGSKVHTKSGAPFDPFLNDTSAGLPLEIMNLLSYLDNDPNNAELSARVGDAYFEIKRFQSAIGYYKKAIDINPGDVDTYNDLGLSYFYLGNDLESIKYLEEGIKKDTSYQRIWLTKGFVLANGMRNYAEAKAAWEKTIDLNPDNSLAETAKEYLNQFEDK